MEKSPVKLDLKNNLYKPELDLLRGLAAIFMITNHMGFLLLSKATLTAPGFASYLMNLTSHAPVLFFFASGIGSGMQSVAKSSQFQVSAVLYKFGLLMIADLFFSLSAGRFFGLNFLGFIGISVLLLELVRCSRKPIVLSIAGIAVIFVMRFVLSPKLHLVNDNIISLATNWALGTSIDGVAYPFSPWFTYPLLGFIGGVYWAKCSHLIENKFRIELTLIFFSLLFALFAVYLNYRGFPFFRWGSVSFGFYILSYAVILLCVPLILLFDRAWSHMRPNLIYLGGVASLAIVPIHYLLLHIVNSFVSSNLNSLTFFAIAFIVIPLCFLIANSVNSIGKKLQKLPSQKHAILALWLLIGTSAVATYYYHQSATSLALLGSTLGQLLICLLFSLKLKKN